MRPLIAIAAMRSPKVDGLRLHGMVVSQKVAEAVYRAGGEPVLLPPVHADHRHPLHHFSGVVLPGGRDIDPTCYGAEADVHPEHGPFDRVHDVVDLRIARDVVAKGIPTLAICRGMQVLNVALGGTLHTDLPTSDVEHGHGFHTVTLDEDSLLAQVMGTPEPSVSTCHHQAVDRLGRDLRVVGRAVDGCVEAVEHRFSPVLAVQWHPEDDAETTEYEQALFDAVVDPARWPARQTLTGAPS
ncbi:gamma-glutamyl-gamma-aminobutyrate hydrolase family protein [Mycobacterium sp. SMC-4]|uniref:gamma-glutamyl-gamma-aminobutyrate hydrolase family protein n=1 Tax=Mycobacterium sp. SMC-4 TaxID=2857059 RepID=UPI003D0560DD